MTELRNWSFMNVNNPRDPSDWRYLQATGHIYGDPRFKDGDFVITSNIISACGRSIVTNSGSHYYLIGPPELAWKEWQAKNGILVDEDQPLMDYQQNKIKKENNK
jgi:hypothetical protein